MDNAGVYKLTSELAIIQTIDFFTPIVDDPYSFGQIAVANSLSDIYTMGGKPLTAMNIVCFPSGKMEIAILQKILLGGADKMVQAGVILIGGHSVTDNELKYGLSVTGTINPNDLITNSGAKSGDKLILTKPLGIGIISTAMKAGKANSKIIKEITLSMSMLNKKASELMLKYKAHACTDITGFSILGHASQMAINSNICLHFDANSIPCFKEARIFAEQGFCPGGIGRNKDFYGKMVDIINELPNYLLDVLYDPQTSGGLLISVGEKGAIPLLNELVFAGYHHASIVGNVTKQPIGRIILS